MLEALPCPTIAVCHGLCLTAAFELPLACDLIVANRSAQFGRELVMTSGIYAAETMHEWGAVARVYDDDGFTDSALRFATRLAEGRTQAHAATKAILCAFVDGALSAADAATSAEAATLFDSEDLPAGIESLLRDGPGRAAFKGR